MLKIGIQGLQQAQQANLRAIRAARPDGGLGRAVLFVTAGVHRHLVSITHVDTGAYRASHYITQSGPSRMVISISPSARNPRTRALTSVYGPIEEARGGGHAAYRRAYEAGPQYVSRAVGMLLSEIK